MLDRFTKSPRIVVLTGAGISAESGISTFRDQDGLWEKHDIMDVATPEGWRKNPELVLQFYNQRRKQLDEVLPNKAHFALTKLQKHFHVDIITQNVDDLHERAGSSNVIHLHGELRKVRSEKIPSLVYITKHWEVKLGDTCEKGHQLRPDIVWFGEDVPLIPHATLLVEKADIILVIGTSLNVYPAAGLLYNAKYNAQKILIDPNEMQVENVFHLKHYKERAGVAVPGIVDNLISEYSR
jgi:NAD-dependent deacetylase